MTCKSFTTIPEYDHDDNVCYPKDTCLALERAAKQLQSIYTVTKTMVDYGYRQITVSCFTSSSAAIEFMTDWDGNGDCLNLFHGEHCLGFVDLWSHSHVFTPLPLRPRVVASSDDIPF